MHLKCWLLRNQSANSVLLHTSHQLLIVMPQRPSDAFAQWRRERVPGFPDSWWALCLCFWMMLFNGFSICKRFGLAPYECRFHVPAAFHLYPFGALVLVKLVPRGKQLEKWTSRLIAAVIVEITAAPAGRWAKMYGVIPLRRLLGNNRPSKVYIRRTIDVIFPERPTFPLRQRLALYGASFD